MGAFLLGGLICSNLDLRHRAQRRKKNQPVTVSMNHNYYATPVRNQSIKCYSERCVKWICLICANVLEGKVNLLKDDDLNWFWHYMPGPGCASRPN